MSYYVLLARSEASVTAIGKRVDLFRGQRMSTECAPEYYEVSYDHDRTDKEGWVVLDYLDAGKGHLLMSCRMWQCLESHSPTGLQGFSVGVSCPQLGVRHDYFLVNILNLLQALDTGAAECDVDEDGFVEDFDSLVIAPDKVKDAKVFRLFESYHMVVVAPEVAIALQQAEFTGVMLISDHQWQPYNI